MINTKDILETINMIDNENLDIRTITMGISLLSCAGDDIERSADKVYDKITRSAGYRSLTSAFPLLRSPCSRRLPEAIR